MSPDVFAHLLPDASTDPSEPASALPMGEEESAFVAASSCDVRDLVDAPCRALEIEYKSWRNLNHPEDRAELARDIAALANHGGGFIVFGFHEHTLLADETDPFRTHCSSERVAAIVQTYLDPPVATQVVSAVSATGIVHPVIRVGGHGSVPVCVRQDGPAIDGEKIIERGVYYLRRHSAMQSVRPLFVARPESGKIESPRDWAALIRRCVRHDRATLLAILDASIDGRVAAPDAAQRLRTWHRAARAAFLALVPRSPVADSLARRHYALSYGFDLIRPEMLEHAQLPERLRHTVFQLQQDFRSGWNMFNPPYRRGVMARFMMDPACGDDDADFLETAWLRARNPDQTADFWRVSPSGLATIVRGYAEDITHAPAHAHRGDYLSPALLAQELAELVCHARTFSQLFSGVRQVVFHCEWWGLAGRELFDEERRWPYRGPALSDHAVASLHIPTARLGKVWPDVVARLMAPVLRAVEPEFALDGTWVREQAPRWAVPPP